MNVFRLGFLLIMLCCSNILWGQYGNFKQLNIQEKLIQSQVINFQQDQLDFLWIATFGGVSIFDGTDFENISKADGLPSNTVYSIFRASNNNMWLATSKGICYFDGRAIHKVKDEIGEDDFGLAFQRKFFELDKQFFYVAQLKAFAYQDSVFKPYTFGSDQELNVFDGLTFAKKKYVVSVKYGLLPVELQNGKLALTNKLLIPRQHQYLKVLHVDTVLQQFLVLTSKGMMRYDVKTGLEQPVTSWNNIDHPANFIDFYRDSKGGEWLATAKGGVYYKKNQTIVHLGSKDGLTNNEIIQVFEDNQGNIWLGTNGDGVFRFNYGPFNLLHKTQYFSGQNISDVKYMPSTKSLFVGTGKGELFEAPIDDLHKFKKVQQYNSISTLLYDANAPNNKMYAFGALGNLSEVGLSPKIKWKGADSILNGPVTAYAIRYPLAATILRKQLWVKKSGAWINTELPAEAHVIKFFNDQLLVVGSDNGAQLFDLQQMKYVSTQALGSTIYDISCSPTHIFLATDDKGLVVYDVHNQTSETIDEQKGLSCNFVYNVMVDGNFVWVGTGCGIDKLNMTDKEHPIINYSTVHGLGAIEANVGAIEKVGANIYIGSMDGLLTINTEHEGLTQFTPKIILKNLLVFSKEEDLTSYSKTFLYNGTLPENPIFPTSYTHLTFDVKAVILGVEKIKYRYQLVGSNDENVYETDQTQIVFTNLTPGQYSLKVWSTNSYGLWGATYYHYDFEIMTPFTQTWYFKVAIMFLLLALYFLIRWWRVRMKNIRLEREEALKIVEQDRIKQRTAEDFHDEIGNKLTKINLLSSMAKTKMSPESDAYGIINQLQYQTQSLYKGAKDIIWSLQPQSNYLHEIISRIIWNAEEMMQLAKNDMQVVQQFADDLHMESYKLIKMEDEVSRNMILIFKEIFNNISKYAPGTQVTFNIKVQSHCVHMEVMDQGKGFSLDNEAHSMGNGLLNMQRRADRIHAQFSIQSHPGKGTKTSFLLPFK